MNESNQLEMNESHQFEMKISYHSRIVLFFLYLHHAAKAIIGEGFVKKVEMLNSFRYQFGFDPKKDLIFTTTLSLIIQLNYLRMPQCFRMA